GVAEPRIGVSLQCPLRHRGAVAMVFEVVADALVAHDAAGSGDIALLHGQDDIVLQGLGTALDENVVRGQTRRSDTEPLASDNVLDLVGDAFEALVLRNRLQIPVERGDRPLALVLIEMAYALAGGE